MKTLIFLVFLLLTSFSHARELGAARANNVLIKLFDEPCKLTQQVTNLPYRITWAEGSKVIEGCFGVFDHEMLAALFEDKTVAVIPLNVVKPIVEARN